MVQSAHFILIPIKYEKNNKRKPVAELLIISKRVKRNGKPILVIFLTFLSAALKAVNFSC